MVFLPFDFSVILIIPALILAFYAQLRVKNTYHTLSRIRAKAGLSGSEVAARLMQQLGLRVGLEEVPGVLNDHYDPSKEILRLSSPVYRGGSVADYSIAAHEVGHALQKRERYGSFALRSFLVPVAGFGSRMAIPLFFFGLIFAFRPLMDIGILFFSLAVLFQLVTLPVEYDASRRAYQVLDASGMLSVEERPLVKKMLNAAALTYVAATAVAALQLIRLLVLRGSRD
ncbi:MAG TPA: zinc metallopeptidase [Atribacteraceae bacterium]|nr:zinc metallopeptidase [Atribacteraceae bacterium]